MSMVRQYRCHDNFFLFFVENGNGKYISAIQFMFSLLSFCVSLYFFHPEIGLLIDEKMILLLHSSRQLFANMYIRLPVS